MVLKSARTSCLNNLILSSTTLAAGPSNYCLTAAMIAIRNSPVQIPRDAERTPSVSIVSLQHVPVLRDDNSGNGGVAASDTNNRNSSSQQMELPLPSLANSIHRPSTSDDSGRCEGETSMEVDCGEVHVRRQTPSIGSSSTKANRRVTLKRIFKSNTSLDRQPKAQIVTERVLPGSIPMKGCRLVQIHTLTHERPLLVAVEKKCQVWDIFTLVMDHLSIADDFFFGLAIRQPAEGIGTDRPRHEYYFLDFDAPFTKYLPKAPRFSSIRKALHQYYLQLRENFIDHWSGPNSVREERCWLLASTALQADLGLESMPVGSGQPRVDKLTFRAEQYLPLWVVNLHGLDFIREQMPALTQNPPPHELLYSARSTCRDHIISFCEEASREPFSLNCHLYSLRRHRSDLMDNALLAISDRGIDMWSVGDGGERIALRSLEWKGIEQLSFDRKKISVGGVDGQDMSLYAQSDQRAKYLLELCKSVHKQLINIKMNQGANSKRPSNSPLYSRGWVGPHRSVHSVDASASSQTPTISSRLTTPEMRHMLVPSSASTLPIGCLSMSNVLAGVTPKSPVFSPRVRTPVNAPKLSPTTIDPSKMIHGSSPLQQGSGQKQRIYDKGRKVRRNHHAISGTDSPPTLGSGVSVLLGAACERPWRIPDDKDKEENTPSLSRTLESSEALQLESALNAAPSPPRMPVITPGINEDQERLPSMHAIGSTVTSGGNGMPPPRIRPIIKMPPKIRQPPQYFEAIEHLNRRPQPSPPPPPAPSATTTITSIHQISAPPQYQYQNQQRAHPPVYTNDASRQSSSVADHASSSASYLQPGHLPPSPLMKPQQMASQKRPLIPASTVKRTVEQFQARYPSTTTVSNGTEQPVQLEQNLDPALDNGFGQFAITTTGVPHQSLLNCSNGVGRRRAKEDVKARRCGAASKSPSHRTAVRVNRAKSMPSSSVPPPELKRPPPPQYSEAVVAVAEERKVEEGKHLLQQPPPPISNGTSDVLEMAGKELIGRTADEPMIAVKDVLAIENVICAQFNTENLEDFPMLKALYLETKKEALSGPFP